MEKALRNARLHTLNYQSSAALNIINIKLTITLAALRSSFCAKRRKMKSALKVYREIDNRLWWLIFDAHQTHTHTHTV